MSKFLVNAVFKILGGASKGYNQGKIDTRAATARAKEISDASDKQTSEREATQLFEQEETKKSQTFELKVNRINQGYAKINALQAQVYATENIQEKAKMQKVLDEAKFYQDIALRGIGQEYDLEKQDLQFKQEKNERIEGETWAGGQSELERKSREKIARLKNVNTLDVENLKAKINKTNNSQSYYIGGNPDVTLDNDLEIEMFGTSKQIEDQKNKTESTIGRPYINFNIDATDSDNERAQKKYSTWVNESPNVINLMGSLLKQGRKDDFKQVMADINRDLFNYKKFLVSKNGININTSSTKEQMEALSVDVISSFLTKWDDGDTTNNSFKDAVVNNVKAFWFNTQNINESEVDRMLSLATNELGLEVSDDNDIVSKAEVATNDMSVYEFIANDMNRQGQLLMRSDLDYSGVQQPLFNRKASEETEKLAGRLMNMGGTLTNEDVPEGGDIRDQLEKLVGIMPSNHYANGYLDTGEQAVVTKVVQNMGMYSKESIDKVFKALKLIMPKQGEDGAPLDMMQYMKATGIDPENIDSKVSSGRQAISTMNAVLGILNENPNIATGKLGMFATKIFELTQFRKEGSFLNVAGSWLKSAGYTLIGAEEEGSMTSRLGKALAGTENLMAKAGKNSDGSGVFDINKLNGDEQALLDTHAKESFMALLAYQVAAAIQGGTGGRTISDQDVANIRKALGEQLFDYGKGAKERLLSFRAVIGKIVAVNESIKKGLGGGIKGIKAGQALSSIYMGAKLSAFKNSGWTGTEENPSPIIKAIFNNDPNYTASQVKPDNPGAGSPAFGYDNVYTDELYKITEDEKIRISEAGRVGDTYYNVGDLYTGQNDPAIIKLFTDKNMFSEKTIKDLNSYRDDILKFGDQ